LAAAGTQRWDRGEILKNGISEIKKLKSDAKYIY
jgi:hypothetical protein